MSGDTAVDRAIDELADGQFHMDTAVELEAGRVRWHSTENTSLVT